MVGLTTLLFLAFAPTTIGNSTAKEPQIAVENDGHVYVTFGDNDSIYVVKSSDAGATFSKPVLVGSVGKLMLGMRRGPRIVAQKGMVTVTATCDEFRNNDGNLVSFRSTDQGKSWSGATRVNDIQGSAREGLHAMAMSEDGTIACTWLDLRSKGTKLYCSISKNGGLWWTKNRLIYASPSGSICECCHPSLAWQGKTLYAMFRNTIGGARDMYLTSTSDLDGPWTVARKLGEGQWLINACPMDGGMIAMEGSAPITVWRREDKVFQDVPGVKETLLSQGRQPWIAVGNDGAYRVWSSNQGIIVAKPQASPIILSPTGTDPVVTSSPNGKVVIAAWTNNGIQIQKLATGP